MNKISAFQLALTLLTLNNYALCMYQKTVSTITKKAHKPHQRNYILTTQHLDTQKGRKDAYQKNCSTLIIWNNDLNGIKPYEPQNAYREDSMEFYKKFASKKIE